LSRQDKCEEAIFAASLCRVVDAYELVELNVQCLREGVVPRRGVGFDPSLGRKAIAEGLKRDVRFLGPRRLQKVPVRHQLGGAMAAMSDRLSGAIPFNSLKPFDSHRFADLVAARCCAAAQLASLHRLDHAVTQVLRLRFCHPLLASAQAGKRGRKLGREAPAERSKRQTRAGHRPIRRKTL
jgi:hypothetical protein